MTILILVCVGISVASLAAALILAGKLKTARGEIASVYNALGCNTEALLKRCTDLEKRAKAAEERIAEIEKTLEDGAASGRDIEKAIARGMDNIFNYSLDTAMSRGNDNG